MLTVACYLWDGEPADRRTRYTPEHVNALARMVGANLSIPHDFVCLTDDVLRPGFDAGVRLVPLPDGVLRWRKRYPKLFSFSPSARHLIGPRFLMLDLDCVVVDDLTPLIMRPEDFVVWEDPQPSQRYNTSMLLMTAGSRPEVWARYGPGAHRRRRGGVGSDQAWVSAVLGRGEATWTAADGVLSYKRHYKRKPERKARIVFFHGRPKPWDLPPRDPVRRLWKASTSPA